MPTPVREDYGGGLLQKEKKEFKDAYVFKVGGESYVVNLKSEKQTVAFKCFAIRLLNQDEIIYSSEIFNSSNFWIRVYGAWLDGGFFGKPGYHYFLSSMMSRFSPYRGDSVLPGDL